MNGYGRQSSFPSFLLDGQRTDAANSLNPLTPLGLARMSQFGPNFNNAFGQLNANEVYNILSGCFPLYSNAHLMGRSGQLATGQSSNNSPSAAISSLTNPSLALAQYQQQLQQQSSQQQTHPQ